MIIHPFAGGIAAALLAGAGMPALAQTAPEPAAAASPDAPAASPDAAPAAEPARHLDAGNTAWRAFDSLRAAAEYEKALEAAPDSYEALAKATLATRDAGEQFKVEGGKEEAVYYREVANANAFTKMLARTFLGGLPDGTNEDAERELLEAVELDPADVYAAYELARTYRLLERADREAEYLERVVALPARAQRDPRLKAEAAGRLAELRAR
jgi:tetratricopeptide (TPR) repeat protein